MKAFCYSQVLNVLVEISGIDLSKHDRSFS